VTAGIVRTPPEAPRPEHGVASKGWFRRMMHGLLRVLIGYELDAIAADVRRHDDEARASLQGHLETRIDQAAAASAELREAFLHVRSEFEEVRDRRVGAIEERLGRIETDAVGDLLRELERLRDQVIPEFSIRLQRELEALRDERVPRVEATLGGLDRSLNDLQEVVERRLRAIESRVDGREQDAGAQTARIDALAGSLRGVQDSAAEVRDQRLPAFNARVDALIGALHADLEATAGLLDRMIQHEPLKVMSDSTIEAALPEALAAASRRFLDTFRGPAEEISARLGTMLPLLVGHAPVLDVGCGRGELLDLVRAAGENGRGIDGDPAMVAACQRRGLAVTQGDAVAAVEAWEPASLGAVTAIHLLEHLPAVAWMRFVAAARTALRPGGILVVECPNPESLRVGAELFWLDPTHRVPIHPQALEFVLRGVGFEIIESLRLHPFPPDQSLLRPGQDEAVAELAARLDLWLSGPRDFRIVARRPDDVIAAPC